MLSVRLQGSGFGIEGSAHGTQVTCGWAGVADFGVQFFRV